MAEHDDLFSPESVDAQIDRLAQKDAGLYSQPHDGPGEALVQDLQSLYHPEVEHYQRTLQRALQRIEAYDQNKLALPEQPTHPLPNLSNLNTRDADQTRLHPQRLPRQTPGRRRIS